MTTAHGLAASRALRLQAGLPRALAVACLWTMFIGTWLILGTLGRAITPLWLAGLGPMTAWLASAGLTDALLLRRARFFAAPVPLIALAVTAGGLAAAIRTGSAPALFAAAIGWGVLGGAMRSALRRRASDAWLPDCGALPHGPADGDAWAVFGARCAMLPMMAASVVATDLCAGAGVSTGQAIAMHLAAMLLPLAALEALPSARFLRSPPWIAALMLGGVAALAIVPGVRGWMAMSVLQAVAWGTACPRPASAASRRRGERVRAALHALGPAAGLFILGLAIEVFGLEGLVWTHVGLALVCLAGTLAWLAAKPGRHPNRGREESLS